jgi:hypothetical protein
MQRAAAFTVLSRRGSNFCCRRLSASSLSVFPYEEVPQNSQARLLPALVVISVDLAGIRAPWRTTTKRLRYFPTSEGKTAIDG